MPSVTKVKSCGRKKVYWLEASGQLVYRDQLSKSVTYDHNKAYELLPKSKSQKPLARCKIRCIADGIKVKKASTFGTQPPRKFYPYKDIQRFYSFNDYPTLLVLGCSDPESRSRYYDIFKFDDQQVQELCELIDRAHSHPLCLLVGDESTLIRYQSSQSSLASDTEKKSEPVSVEQALPVLANSIETEDNGGLSEEVLIEEEPLLETCENHIPEVRISLSLADEPLIETVEHEQIEIHAPATLSDPKDMETNEGLYHRCPIPEHLRSDPLFESLCQNVKEDDLWAVDMKYIDAHPQYGNQIVPEGAVYLFVAHHKYPEVLMKSNEELVNHHSLHMEEDGLNTAEVEFSTKFVQCPTISG